VPVQIVSVLDEADRFAREPLGFVESAAGAKTLARTQTPVASVSASASR
jgi:hypothetical protein